MQLTLIHYHYLPLEIVYIKASRRVAIIDIPNSLRVYFTYTEIMQLNFSLFTLAATSVAAIASAAPATFQKRAEFCGQYDTTTAGDYTIYNNLWGKDAASSGSQCTEVLSSSGNTISWQTSWSWSGASSNVKSYANAALNFTAKKISSLSSVPFTWNWSYTGSDIDADVAFDIWVSPTTSTR